MKRIFTKDPKIQPVQEAARDAATMLDWESQIPFGRVTVVHNAACIAYLGTLHRVSSGASVTLQAVDARLHQSRVVVIRNCSAASSSTVRPARGGKINGLASTSLAAGNWGIFVATPDADDDWIGLY